MCHRIVMAIQNNGLGLKTKNSINRNRRRKRIRKINVLNLPNNILEQIFIQLNISENRNVRATCHRFMNVADEALQHNLNVNFVRIAGAWQDKSEVRKLDALTTVVEAATSIYCAHFDYTIVYNNLIRLIYAREFTRPPKVAEFKKIRGFLMDFYEFVHSDLAARDPSGNLFSKLFSIMLLNVLQKFKDATSAVSFAAGNYALIQYDLNGCWFGVVGSPGTGTINTLIDANRNNFLIILFHLLMAERCEQTLLTHWNRREWLFVYGRSDIEVRSRKSKRIVVDVYGLGSETFISSLMDAQMETVTGLLLANEGKLFFEITCCEGCKWGSQVIHNLK